MKTFFDHAAAMFAEETFLRYYEEAGKGAGFINPEGLNQGAYDARKMLESCGTRLSQALTGTGKYKTHWCASGTDAMRLACELLAEISPTGSIVFTTGAEHPSLTQNLKRLFGSERVQIVPMDHNGAVDTAALATLLKTHQPCAFFVHHVNAETGRVQDLHAIRAVMREASPATLLCADTIQSAAKISLQNIPAEMLMISAHKIGAPAYAALLYDNPAWESHFTAFRKAYLCGRPELPLARTLVHATEDYTSKLEAETARLAPLKAYLIQAIRELAPETIFPTPPELASPWILSVVFPKHQGAVLVRMLSQEGVYVGAGSACQAESKTPSSSLTTLGFSPETAYGLLRFSFSRKTTLEDAQMLIDALKKVLKDY